MYNGVILVKRRRHALIAAVALCTVLAALLFAGTLVLGKPGKQGKGAQPPKDKKVRAVQTLRPTKVMTENGLLLLEVPEGTIFEVAEHKGNVVWISGPSGTRYQIRRQDVRAIPEHKVSMHGYDDAQLKQFGRQASAARVAAVMQSAFPEKGTQLTIAMRTEWQDKVEIEMAIKMEISVAQYSLMASWAVYKGWLD